jgi:hypothetical protein
MRKGSTSFGACEVRRWHWLFRNKIPVSIRGWDNSAGGSWLKGVPYLEQDVPYTVSRIHCLGFQNKHVARAPLQGGVGYRAENNRVVGRRQLQTHTLYI